MKHLFAFVVAVLLIPTTLLAQDAVITGVVTTKDDGSALPGASVSIEELNLSTTTDGSGRYTLTVPAESVNGQPVKLTVVFQGLQTRTMDVRLAPGDMTRDVALIVSFGESITVGSRAIGAAEEKAVPVDIITQEQIAATPSTETNQIIQTLAPSFNFARTTITDGTDSVRPATLRGLGPDQMLVLINGKRRHSSALVNVNNSVGRGSAGIDLNAIPASAIGSIEVLRDGAAAQYGSDAIAGVINLVLKSGVEGGEFTLKGGATSHGDGELVDVGLNYGIPVGRGSLFAAVEYRDRGETNRARDDPRDQIVAGDAGNNAVPQPNFHWGDSDARDSLIFLNFATPVSTDGETIFYAFGGYGNRVGSHGGNYRRALQNTNWRTIYPLGYLPLIEPDIDDASLTGGVRGDFNDWYWDASAQYGHNRFDFNISNSLNVSLGPNIPPNQTEFYSGGLEFNQLVGNLDISRGFNLGMAGPINVAFGAEFRDENYQIHAGEPASYIDGGQPNQDGGRATPAAQVFPGFRPADERDVSRSNYALYVDLEGDVLEKLRVGVAARFEDYDDFGSTSDYKLTGRYAIVDQFIVRASFSTGFRAPSLGQSYFSAVSTNFLSVGGVLTPFEVGTFPVSSPVARVLGAQDLEPEDSRHISGGVVWQPLGNLEFTADVFHIEIDNRIVFSGNFTGPLVAPLLAPFNVTGARFFTNAIDTETDGYDLVVNYQPGIGSFGRVDLSAAYSHNENKVTRIADTPPQLRGLQETLFDRIERRRVLCSQPQNNLRLMQQYSNRGFTGTMREAQYGEYCSTDSNNLVDDQVYDEQWVADLDLSYSWNRLVFGVGVQNVFDSFPDENRLGTPQANLGIFKYPRNSPAGMNGRFVYSRVGVKF